MKVWIRRSLVAIVALVAVVVIVVFGAASLGDNKRERRIEFAVASGAYRTDAASVERGGYLFRSRGCGGCHGANGAGESVIDDGKGMRIVSPDITPAGIVATYTPDDWDRVIRHGVKPDRRPVFVMPSEDFARFTDDDLASVVAYVRQLPPQQGNKAVIELPLPVRVLYGIGVIKDSAEKIDHTLASAKPVPAGVTVEHGKYVANDCLGCHRAGFVGGKIPGTPPSWPPAARLASGDGSVMPRYKTVAEFAAMLKTGKRPDGSAVSQVMPFSSLRELSDVDVQALYLYLSTLPQGA